MSMTLFTNLKSGNFLSLSFTSAAVVFDLLEIDWPHEDGRVNSVSIGRLSKSKMAHFHANRCHPPYP